MAAKKIILRFKNDVTPEEMFYYSKKVKYFLEKDKVLFVDSSTEVFIVEDGDDIRIEKE